MPVSRHLKAQRKAQRQNAPINYATLRRSESLEALAELMQPYGNGPKRFSKDASTYRYKLENASKCIQQYRQEVAAEKRREQDRLAELVPVPLEHITYAWTWHVCFPVRKPKKQKKQWDDVGAVIAGPSRAEVERALQLHCDQKRWEFQGLYGAAPHSLAYAFDRRNGQTLSAWQQQVIPRPEPFGQLSPPEKPKTRKPARKADSEAVNRLSV